MLMSIAVTVAVVPDLLMRRRLDWSHGTTMVGPARTVALPSTCSRIERHDPSWLSRLRRRRGPLFPRSTSECAHSRELLPQSREMLLRGTSALIELQERNALATLENSP